MKEKWGGRRAIAGMVGGLLTVAAAGPVLAEPVGLSGLNDFRLVSGNAASQAVTAAVRAEDLVLHEPAAQRHGPYDLPDPAPAQAMADPDPAAGRYNSFGRQLEAISWETAAVFGYYTAINAKKLFRDPVAPHFQREGWLGRDTHTMGVDKLAHAYSTYVVSDILFYRLKRKTGNAPGIALTAAALGSAVGLYTELWDSIEPSGGWSWEDVAFNTAGAGFSLLRNSVPGLDKKLDYRLLIIPNSRIISPSGKGHFEQQRYLFALKLAGFGAFERGPLRLVELHAAIMPGIFPGATGRGGSSRNGMSFSVSASTCANCCSEMGGAASAARWARCWIMCRSPIRRRM